MRPKPPIVNEPVIPEAKMGAFFVQDIYQGLQGVKRGEIKWLRVIEETSRVSGTHGAEYNQQFLLSAALAFSVKNYLGIVPVEEDGSAYFKVPSGRAVYLQALDAEGRLVQSMRTFVQASPGVVRSCIGCHETKYSAATNMGNKQVLQRAPSTLQPESWGSGFVDYPSMVQPIFDKHCVSCHGGEQGFAQGLDLSGGWTDHFNVSYQNLVNRRNHQLTATLISGIDCMNGTALWSAQRFEARSHGSGNAPLAQVLVSGHEGRIKNLTREERDLILAWIDTNGLYHGTWDYAEGGARLKAYAGVKAALIQEMRQADCLSCHENQGKCVFEDDWFNLARPEMSRILRAPLAKEGDGYGVEACRDHPREAGKQRIRMYFTGGYVHHVLPVESFKPVEFKYPDTSGRRHVSFASTEDRHYQAMLAIIKGGRRQALAEPRTDMPGAKLVAGICKQTIAFDPPALAPALKVEPQTDGVVQLHWERSAHTIGLSFDLHRANRPNFKPSPDNLLNRTRLFKYADFHADAGKQYYALTASSRGYKSRPAYATVDVPGKIPVPVPEGTSATPLPGEVRLTWQAHEDVNIRYNIYRRTEVSSKFVKLNDRPLGRAEYNDVGLDAELKYRYVVRSVNRKGIESGAGDEVICQVRPEVKAPVFEMSLSEGVGGLLLNEMCKGTLVGAAKCAGGILDLSSAGHVTFPHSRLFDLTGKLTVECRLRLDSEDQMPVIVSCGRWNDRGWFLQKLGGFFRWHVGGVDCDGGKAVAGQWLHLVCVYDGHLAKLYQNGGQVASVTCSPGQASWDGELVIGQYSGGLGGAYQVKGTISQVKIYRRAIGAKEAAEKFASDS